MVWKKHRRFGYITLLQCGENRWKQFNGSTVQRFNGFLHTEEGLYTRNVCVSFKPFLTLFDNYFYISPIRKHFQVSRICKELSFLRSLDQLMPFLGGDVEPILAGILSNDDGDGNDNAAKQ